ncbi:MAG: PD-(D/E)XK nuclease family protein, partial [Myxococcota bacterium]
ADAVADQLPVPVSTADEARSFCGGARFVRAPDRGAAARWVARDLSEHLRAGVDPTECAVLLADPAGDGALLAEVFADHGIPYRPAGGAPVGGHPVVSAVRAIAGQALAGFDPDGLCALADLCPTFGADARALRRWARAAGVTGGRPRDWPVAPWASRTRAAPVEQVEDPLAALDALAERLVPFAAPATVADWARRLHDTFADLGLPDRCAHGDAAHAWASAVRELDALVRDAARALPGEVAPEVLRDELDRALAGARWDPSPRATARVSLVPFDEAPIEPPTHTWVLGGIRGRFPTPPSPTLARIDPTRVGYDAPARHRMGALLREQAVRWVWPATQNGSAVAPSPLLAEVLDLPTAVPGVRLGEWVVEDVRAEAYGGSASDRARATPPASLDRAVASVLARTGPLGPYDGWFDVPPPPPPSLSVSALETYVACPARYWYAHGLSLSPPDDAAPELEPRRRGIALHAILERFLSARSLAPLAGERDVAGARAALHRVASAVLDEVESGGGFDPLFQQYARRRWLAGLADDRPAGVLRVWLDGELASVGVVPEAVEWPVRGLVLGGVPIRGIVDRIDRVGGATVVTDYKTGTPPSRARIDAGLSLQPLAYAEMVARQSGRPVAATFLSLARADRVRRTTFVGESAALDATCSEAERRRAVVVEAPERARRLERAGA